LAKPKADVKHVIFFSRDLYSTNVPLEDCLRGDVIVAYQLDGADIPLLHGGPVRMIIPHLYGWKSAKFLNRIKFRFEMKKVFGNPEATTITAIRGKKKDIVSKLTL